MLSATGPPRSVTLSSIDKFGRSFQTIVPADSNGKFIGPYSLSDNAFARNLVIQALGYHKYLELSSYAPYQGKDGNEAIENKKE